LMALTHARNLMYVNMMHTLLASSANAPVHQLMVSRPACRTTHAPRVHAMNNIAFHMAHAADSSPAND